MSELKIVHRGGVYFLKGRRGITKESYAGSDTYELEREVDFTLILNGTIFHDWVEAEEEHCAWLHYSRPGISQKILLSHPYEEVHGVLMYWIGELLPEISDNSNRTPEQQETEQQ